MLFSSGALLYSYAPFQLALYMLHQRLLRRLDQANLIIGWEWKVALGEKERERERERDVNSETSII